MSRVDPIFCDYKELSPKGGKRNPFFHISRARLSLRMVTMDKAGNLRYVREIRTFYGKADLAWKLTHVGVDPYAVIWGLQ